MPNLSENAETIANARWFLPEEDWTKCCVRVAKHVASAEKDRYVYEERFAEMIYNMEFLPGGRILRNAGRPRGSLFQCYNVPIEDSIVSIGTCKAHSMLLWSGGGGVGITFSALRPEGSPIKGEGGESSGLVSFMRTIDFDASVIKTGGGRRAAALGLLHVDHPEIENFIDCKLKEGELSHFNISVAVNKDFMEKVHKNELYELKFNNKTYKTMNAGKIWNKIVGNMVKNAEPGLINWDNAKKNNSYYFAPVRGCNPCGEAIMEAYGACCLGSLVLPAFVHPGGNTNWLKMEKVIRTAIRFLDDIIDVNQYALQQVKDSAINGRRVGLGVMGLAEYLFAKKIRYGSTQSISEVEKLTQFVKNVAYDESVKLSSEKGSFPKFDPTMYCQASFVRKLPAKVRMSIRDHGIRNVTLLAYAPTGSISMLPEVSSGIEPLYAKAYLRKDRIGERVYIHPFYKETIEEEETDNLDWFVDAGDIPPESHFEIQVACQKNVDGGVSKTINLPKDATISSFDKALQEYIYDLKGVTVYRDGSRGNQPLNRLSEASARKYLKGGGAVMSVEEQSCATGNCSI